MNNHTTTFRMVWVMPAPRPRYARNTNALIAAVAIRADAGLLTLNADDFQPFVNQGLRLV